MCDKSPPVNGAQKIGSPFFGLRGINLFGKPKERSSNNKTVKPQLITIHGKVIHTTRLPVY